MFHRPSIAARSLGTFHFLFYAQKPTVGNGRGLINYTFTRTSSLASRLRPTLGVPSAAMSSQKLEIGCPGCGRTLRVSATHAGRQIRCPNCQQISVAPNAPGQESQAAHAANAAPEAPFEPPTWYVQTPEGPIYGPITWTDMRQWAAEGRIDRDCRVGQAKQGPWQAAAERLPELPVRHGADGACQTLASQRDSAAALPGAPEGWVAPHRGGLIFLLGLLGFVVGCPLFSFLAWVMGARDLAEIRARRMDSQGAGLTLGGMLLGIIVSVLWMILLCVLMTVALVFVALRM